MRDNNCPCNGCKDREIACSGHCKKDARGEYGYKAWLADYRKREADTKERKRRDKEAFIRSEQCKYTGVR